VLLGRALRRSEVAALSDGRCSGGFTPKATVAARRANPPELWVVLATPSACWPHRLRSRRRTTGGGRRSGQPASQTGRRHRAREAREVDRRQVRQTGSPSGRPRRFLNAPDITTTQGSAAAGAVRADSSRRRRSPHGTRIRRSWQCRACDFRPGFLALPCGFSARRGVAGGTARPSASRSGEND
jgi:hypothetical protein